MDAFRRRTPDQVASLAEELRHQLAARLLGVSALQLLLEQFKFRDQHGDTWTLGPLTQVWYLHQPGHWIASPTGPNRPVDGPADLALSERSGVPAAPGFDVADEGAKDAAKGADPAEYFRAAVSRISRAYDSGAIRSDLAEAQLQDLYAVDGGGTVWMLGVQTRLWYTFSGTGWARAQHSLDRSMLESAQSPEGGGEENIRGFLKRTTNFIPEPIVPAWTPAAGFPEHLVTCPNCDGLNVGEIAQCISCGRSLKAAQPAAPRIRTPPPAAPGAPIQPPAPQATAQPPAAVERTAPEPPATALPSADRAFVPAGAGRSNRLWWLIGGCCLGILCLAGLLATIVGFGLVPTISMRTVPGPEPTPDVASTPAPSNILLEDNFEDPDHTAVPLFGTEAMEFQVDTANGVGVMTGHVPGVLAAMYESPIAMNFVATLEMIVPATGVGAEAGMVFRSDDVAGGLSHYYLVLASPADGSVRLVRWDSGAAHDLANAPLRIDPTGEISLTVRATGGRIEVEINGEPGIRMQDAPLEFGIFGLALYGAADGDQAVFREFRVEAPQP